jgi:hypothetical protein
MDSLESKVEKLKNAWHEFTMGIMNSDLLKVGVDILTKFLEVINKATEGFGGLSSSILKIGSVLAIFKIGKKLFDNFRAPVVRLFADIIKEAGVAGEKSMDAYHKGAEKKQKEIQNAETSEAKAKKAPLKDRLTKENVKGYLGEVTGVS